MAAVAILGPGGVGGFVAAALWRAGCATTVVAREPTAELIARSGLEVDSTALDARFTARPDAVSRLCAPVRFLLVATKAGGLTAALERVESDPELVVPLLNGVEHMAALRARFGEQRVVAGVIRIESDRPAPGRIVQRSPGARIDLASNLASNLAANLGVGPAAADHAAAELATILRGAGITVRIGDDERQVLWSKLARLNALALTTSAADRPLGVLRDDPRWRSALEGAVNETVAVANAAGAALRAADTLAELEGAHPELGSSMQRDIAAGREPELDALAGAVLRAGAAHGLRCPTVTWLAERVAARAGLDWVAPRPTAGV